MIVKEKSEKSPKTPPAKEKSDTSSKKASKKQKKMATNTELKCPICCETLGLDEYRFYPCRCGYQICSFCWHRIKTDENSLCPACRRPYPDDPVNYKPLSQEEIQKLKSEKKMKDIQKKKEIAESRKQFANIRVVQKNLIYIHGLPLEIDLDDNKWNKLQKLFKEYGPITKCVINNKTNYAGSQTPKASAYVTYQKIEDALRAYKKLPNTRIEGHDVKTSLGTTKYCSNFLKNVHCPKQDCMYLHEMADEELCFTKEQIHAGEHLKCGDMLYERMILHNQQRMVQCSQPKEPAPSEKSVTPEAPSPKEEPTHGNCEESRDSPVQSRLQQYLSKSESQSSLHEDEYHSHYNGQPEPHLFVETSRSSILNSEPEQVLRSCQPSEETYVNNSCPSVNNSHSSTIKPFQNFPTPHSNPQDMHNGDLWHEQRNMLLGNYGNLSQPIQQQQQQQQQNVLLYDTRSAPNIENVKSSIFNRLPYTNHGTNSLSENFEPRTEQYDDDLGFDPCGYSLRALEDLIQTEPKVNTAPTIQRYGRNHPHLQTPKQQMDLQEQQQEHNQLLRLRLAQQQMLRQKNPPPGFSLNSFPSNHPPPSSPVYEPRNPTLPSRMSPIMNVSNSFNSMRGGGANYTIPRITPGAGISHNTNTIANGFSPQTVRIPPQSLQMHDFMSRSTQQNAQNLHSQRFENLSQPQFATVEQPNLSPSFWNNINQSQWIAPENCIQNQGMPVDCRPGSPLLNIRRMQQMRQNEYNRHIQQMTARVNSMGFTDVPQYLFPNSQQQQQQQQQQGVHTFP